MSTGNVAKASDNLHDTLGRTKKSASLAYNEQLLAGLNEAEMARRAKNNKKWHRRFKIFLCCLGLKKNKDSIADVSTIFADFFADLNVPNTDLAAGFVLVSKYQAAQRKWIENNEHLDVEKYLSSIPITSKTKFLDISTAEDSHLINDLIYYMNYSLAIFGWQLHMVENPCMLCCMCPYLRPSKCCGGQKIRPTDTKLSKKHDKKNKNKANSNSKDKAEENEGERKQSTGMLHDEWEAPVILGDNFIGCNVASVENRLSAHNYEIIYMNYKDNISIVPFLVAADHSKRTIVVAIRGSMSLSDIVTDMNAKADSLPMEDCPDDWLAHKGMLKAAVYVKTMLLREHILDRAFNCNPDLGTHDYTLLLTGHSLGAGVAAILGILMRKQYPTLKAYLYSPPGGCLSLPAVEYTKEFAIGILLGNDCVPRLGLSQLERLRYYILLSLKNSEKSTGKILTKAICPTCCLGGNKVEYDPSLSLDVLHGTEGRTFDYLGNKIQFQRVKTVLYVPGRLIHVVKNNTYKSKARRLFNEPIYQAVWNENTEYDRIVVAEGMLYDHLPHILMHGMKMLICKTLPCRKETTELNDCLNDASAIRQNGGTDSSSSTFKDIIASKQELSVEIDSNNNKSMIHDDVIYDENNNDKSKHSNKALYLDMNSKSTKSTSINSLEEIESAQISLPKEHTRIDVNGNEDSISNKNYIK